MTGLISNSVWFLFNCRISSQYVPDKIRSRNVRIGFKSKTRDFRINRRVHGQKRSLWVTFGLIIAFWTLHKILPFDIHTYTTYMHTIFLLYWNQGRLSAGKIINCGGEFSRNSLRTTQLFWVAACRFISKVFFL